MNKVCYTTQGIKLAISVPFNYELSSFSKNTLKILFKNIKGFTLAETLITLTVIGVIAALTVPTLVANYQKHVYAVSLKKMYSQLTNAMKMIPASANCSADDFQCAGVNSLSSNNSSLATVANDIDILANQFKSSKLVTAETDEHCNSISQYGNRKCIYTEDGMMIISTSGALNFLTVDINGVKGPNKTGRDIFMFFVATENSNKPVGTVTPVGYTSAVKGDYTWCNPSRLSDSCTGRVLYEGKMNY